MATELDDSMKSKRLIPFQAHEKFIELMDQAVERTRELEAASLGESYTDRSKFIRSAIREKIARAGIEVTETA